MQLDDLYRRVIMDHYKNPAIAASLKKMRNHRFEQSDLRRSHFLGRERRGSRCQIYGEGRSISMSSASMMTDAVKAERWMKRSAWRTASPPL